MSYHHTCPGCAIDQARRRCDEPDRGTLCERCSESGALAYVIRLYWQGICERSAIAYEADAMTLIGTYAGSDSDDISHHGWALAQALRDRADQLRAWAKEAR